MENGAKKDVEGWDKDLIEVDELYERHSNYYLKILRSMEDKIFNWSFTLNTGGLAGAIAFMATFCKDCSSCKNNVCIFILIILAFMLGIALILIAAFLEKKRFAMNLTFLDSLYEKFCIEKIKKEVFLKKVESINDKQCLKTGILILEILSFSMFLLGLIVSIISMVQVLRG